MTIQKFTFFSSKHFIWYVLLLATLIRGCLLYYNLTLNPSFSIQQDNYADFTLALGQGTLASGGVSYFDTRLFPGYPAVILVVGLLVPVSEIAIGVAISFLSSLVAIYLFWKWSGHQLATWLMAVFPPVWLGLATKVATEPLAICLMLVSILLLRKKHYLVAGLVLGFACLVRNIAVFAGVALTIELLLSMSRWQTKGRQLLLFGTGGVVSAIVLLLFNYWQWGADNLFYQFMVYTNELDTSIGLVMLFQNIYRTLDWGQYRILVSGLAYVVVTGFGMVGLFKRKDLNPVFRVSFFWAALSLLFILSLSMHTFLEDFSRYSIVVWPAIALGLSSELKSCIIQKIRRGRIVA